MAARTNPANGKGSPLMSQVALVERPSEVGGARFSAIKPETLASVLAESAAGRIEQWFDLVDKMLETDAHLASLLETRIKLLTGCAWSMEPGAHEPHEEQLAKDAAEFCTEQLQQVDDLERVFGDLDQALFTGLSAYEHEWQWSQGVWCSYPTWVAPRLFRFGDDWQLEVRNDKWRWTDLPEGKFIVHMPRAQTGYPTRAALLRGVAWEWCFKFWAVFFWTSGAERLGSPPMVGTVDGNVDRRVRDALRENLELLASGQAAVLEANTGVSFPDPGFSGSASVWQDLVKHFDAAESKRIVGSTLNIEVGQTGGAYALADSQAATTIRPRIVSDGYLLGGTLARDWCAPILKYNSHLFGGRIPPTPCPVWNVEVGKQRTADALVPQLITTGSLKRDELRELAGLDGIGGVRGEEIVSAPTPTGPPAFSTAPMATDSPGGAGPARPFSRTRPAAQLILPLTTRTPSPSQPRTSALLAALSDTSDAPQS